jgi:hypothetical protein
MTVKTIKHLLHRETEWYGFWGIWGNLLRTKANGLLLAPDCHGDMCSPERVFAPETSLEHEPPCLE